MRAATELQLALRACRGAVLFLFALSFGINMLALASPLYMMQLYDRVVSSRSIDTLIMLTLIFAGAIALMAVFDSIRNRTLGFISVWLDDRLGPASISAGLGISLTGGAVRASEAMRDLATIRGFLGGPTVTPLIDAPWAPLFLGMLFLLDPLIGVFGLASAAALFGLAVANEFLTRGPLRRAAQSAAQASRAIDSAFRNAEVVAAMGMRDAIVRLWRREARDGKQAQEEASRRAATIQSLSRFVRLFVQSGIMGVGAWLVINDHATPGVMFGASFLIARALAPVENAITTWRSVLQARMAYRRLRQLMETAAPAPAGMPLARPAGFLAAERIMYAPLGSDTPILRGVSFSLEPGEVMGLIGPSAAGKTTLARILVGAWRPNSGYARLDGGEISVWLGAGGARHIGYLPQDVELFQGSVKDNVSRLEAADPEAVVAAAKLAGLHEIIMRFPHGYDTDIGEGGMNLSGGLRQRVALARAIYGVPRLIVLDEPNASLDSEGEAALVEAVAELKARGSTIVVIAHRPSILQHADKLLVLRNGAVEQFGSRLEVIAKLNAASTVIGPSRTPISNEPQKQSASI